MAKKDQSVYRPQDFRVNSFDPMIEGVDPITPEGTPVPKTKEKAVVDAAEAAGVGLVKDDEPVEETLPTGDTPGA